jgi:hypothetical protein
VTASPEHHLLPARAALREEGLHVALADIPVAELHDAFLQDTLRRVVPELKLARLPSPEDSPEDPRTAPAGLIFHVARCGSTLVSQLLKLQPGLAVYSEPPAINELLVPPHAASRARLVGSLRAIASQFSGHAGGPYVLKLSSWNVLFCDVIAEAFPLSPWALCLRDPLEVCVSLQARPPAWLRDATGPLWPYIGAADRTEVGPSARNVAQTFASFCAAAHRLDPVRGLLLRYEDLPQAVWEDALPRFQMSADDRTVARMRAASRNDAKAPLGQAKPFTDDVEHKRLAAGTELREQVEAIARPALDRLIRRMAG